MDNIELDKIVEKIFTLANNQFIKREDRISEVKKEIINLCSKQRALGRRQAINFIQYSIDELKEKQNI